MKDADTWLLVVLCIVLSALWEASERNDELERRLWDRQHAPCVGPGR